jgi:hypothetical protein
MVQISYRGIPVAAIISPERIVHRIHIENWTRTLFWHEKTMHYSAAHASNLCVTLPCRELYGTYGAATPLVHKLRCGCGSRNSQCVYALP